MNKYPIAFEIGINYNRFNNYDWDEDALFEPPKNRSYGTLFSETEDFDLPATLYFRAFFTTQHQQVPDLHPQSQN